MIKRIVLAAMVAPFLLWGAPATAGRTAIDEDDDGNQITASFSGYCDYNGEDCGDGSGLFYKVSIGGADFTDRVIVHGNGLLTFGAAVDFLGNSAVRDAIDFGNTPLLTDYERTLVSTGQNNEIDFQSDGAFMQSARLGTNATTGAITATWFTCDRPSAPGVCDDSNLHTLTLTPTRGGFAGRFSGGPGGSDRGYVSDGVFTATGETFFLRAVFDGLTPGVPEPASWALMIAGFGMTGAALRRQNRRAPVALA